MAKWLAIAAVASVLTACAHSSRVEMGAGPQPEAQLPTEQSAAGAAIAESLGYHGPGKPAKAAD